MKGILVLAHGSREKETELILAQIIKMTQERLKDVIIETAYLQFSDVNLEKGLDKLIEKNVTEIKVIPYFLFSGVHIREDIPREIEEYLANKSNVKITMGNTLGADPRLADILADRISDALC